VSNDSNNPQQSAPLPDKKPQLGGGSIKGTVIGEGGRPVADASIVAFPVNLSSNVQAMITSFFRPVNSDADGKFEMTGMQPGAYTLGANALGYVLSDTDSMPYHRPGETVTLTLVKGGVITGKVTNSSGDPVVGAVVRAIKIREADNKPLKTRAGLMSQVSDSMGFLLASLGPYKADDRGIYRIYGLEAGYYQVAAGGRSGQGFNPGAGAYDGDAPTYYPSGTIDTAAEVIVRAGEEATGIDIRYRDNRGHSISGTLSGSKGQGQDSVQIFLTRANNGILEGTTYVLSITKEKGFIFDAVLDGDYNVSAIAGSGALLEGADGITAALATPRRVTMAGADVTGIELALEPLASIAGRVVLEPVTAAQKAECKPVRSVRLEEIVVSAPAENSKRAEDQSIVLLSMFKDTTPTEKGDFTVNYLRTGVHRFEFQFPGEQFYAKSITLPPTTPNGKLVDAARSGVMLKSGNKVKGLVVTISEGAAALRGNVVTGKGKDPPFAKMRVYLAPAEPDAADDVLRYFESEVAADGSFALTCLAPGKYWLVGRELSEQQAAEADHKPLAWDAGGRMSLRFEGEASKQTVELHRCERVTDFVLEYTPLIKPTKPARKLPQ